MGTRLVSRLTAQGHNVRVLTRDVSRARGQLPYGRLEFFAPNDWARALAGATAVINLAGEHTQHAPIQLGFKAVSLPRRRPPAGDVSRGPILRLSWDFYWIAGCIRFALGLRTLGNHSVRLIGAPGRKLPAARSRAETGSGMSLLSSPVQRAWGSVRPKPRFTPPAAMHTPSET